MNLRLMLFTARRKLRQAESQLAEKERQLAEMTALANDASRRAQEAEGLLFELEERLRRALGNETALTVTAAQRAVRAISGQRGKPLRWPIQRPLRWAEPDAVVDHTVSFDALAVELNVLVAAVEDRPDNVAKMIRMWEVTSGGGRDKLPELAYLISDQALAAVGPSSLDIQNLLRSVMKQLLNKMQESFMARSKAS